MAPGYGNSDVGSFSICDSAFLYALLTFLFRRDSSSDLLAAFRTQIYPPFLRIRLCFRSILFTMASTARTFARAAVKSTPSTSAFKTSSRNTAFTLQRQSFRQQSRRGYASEPTKSSSSGLYLGIGALALGGAGYYFYTQTNGSLFSGSAGETKGIFAPKFADYQKVYNEVAARLEEKDDYDDGSYGPVLVRLAWHASGTYDVETGTGGSNGATMRFSPEGDHGANAGLKAARDFLEPVKGTCSPSLINWSVGR